MTDESVARVKAALAALRRFIEAQELVDLAVECGGGTAKPRLGRPPGSRNKAKTEAQG
jgi:hypothetical protein